MGFSRQEYWSGVPLPSPMGTHSNTINISAPKCPLENPPGPGFLPSSVCVLRLMVCVTDPVGLPSTFTEIANIFPSACHGHIFTCIVLVHPHHSPTTWPLLPLDFSRLKLKLREVQQLAKGHTAKRVRIQTQRCPKVKSSQLPLSSYAYCQLPMSFSGLTEQGRFLKKIRTCAFKEVKQSTLYLVITTRAGAGGASEAPAPQHARDTHLSPRCVCVLEAPCSLWSLSRADRQQESTCLSLYWTQHSGGHSMYIFSDSHLHRCRHRPAQRKPSLFSNAMKWQRT